MMVVRSDPVQIVRRIACMQENGSSVLLKWGEDDGTWECSWITGSVRYVGRSQSLGQAVEIAMENPQIDPPPAPLEDR